MLNELIFDSQRCCSLVPWCTADLSHAAVTRVGRWDRLANAASPQNVDADEES